MNESVNNWPSLVLNSLVFKLFLESILNLIISKITAKKLNSRFKNNLLNKSA